jgi:hypothetical protein
MKKGDKAPENKDRRNSSQKDEFAKTGWIDFGLWRVQFC